MSTRGPARSAAVRASPVVRPLQVVFAVNGALYGTLLPRFPQVADRLGATEGQFGLALVGVGVGGLVGSAAVTWVARRAGGPARAVAWTAPAMALAVAGAGLAPSVAWLFVALLVLGLADGVCDPAMNAVGAAEQQRVGAVFMGRLHATWSAATLAATGVGALLAGAGVATPTHVLASAAVLLPVHAVASRRLARLAPGGATGKAGATGAGATGAGATGAPRRGGRPALWAATATVAFAAVMVEVPPQEWAGLLLARELDAGPGVAGAGPFAFLGGVLLLRLVLDRLVDRLGWRAVGVAGAAASVVGTSGGLLVGAVTGSAWPVLVGLVVAGAGAGPQFPLLFDRADEVARRLGLPPDAGAGVVATGTRAAVLVGPLLVGQVADRAGLFAGLAVVPLAGLVMLPGLLVLLRPWPSRSR